MTPCRICGDTAETNGTSGHFATYRKMLGPKWRASIKGWRDWMCWRCQVWAARAARLIA